MRTRDNDPELKAMIQNHVITAKDRADKPIIEAHIRSHLTEAGKGFKEIRDRKLYLIDADTIEEYAQIEWGKSRAWFYQQIGLEEMRDSLPESVSILIDTVPKADAIKQVPVKHRVPVLQQVTNSGAPVTARAISEAAKTISMPPEDDGVIDADEVFYDETGFLIPKPLVAFYQRGGETKELLTRIASLRGALRRAQDGSDPLFRFVNISTTMALLDNTYGELKMAVPHAVCPYCQGKTIDHCTVCRKTGFLPKHQWDHAVPSDLKAVREKSCKK